MIKSKYWKFSGRSRTEFEDYFGFGFLNKVNRRKLRHGGSLDKYNGLFARFNFDNKLVRGNWIVLNKDGTRCDFSPELFKQGNRTVKGYFELRKEVTINYVKNKLHPQQSKDFIFEKCDKEDVIPEGYFWQENAK